MAAQPTVDVAVDGTDVEEGENVTVGPTADVNVTVTSDEPLSYVDVELDGERASQGGEDATRFRLNQTVELGFGLNRYTVTATSDAGTTRYTVGLRRPATDRRELQEQIQQIRQQLRLIEDRNAALEQQRENLSAENERLRERLNESGGTDGGQGLPGFGPAAALVALVGVLAALARR